MSEFSCQIKIPDIPGLERDDLTVGREFLLDCAGPWPEITNPSALKAELAPTDAHKLKILDVVSVRNDGVEFKVTSYIAGDVKIENLVVTDGVKKTSLGPMQFTVRSVIDAQQPQQEPYGPLGPLVLTVPASWWMTFAVVLALAVLALGLRWRRVLQHRRLLRRLAAYDSAMGPAAEFHQKIRRLRRDSPVFSGGAVTDAEAAKCVADLETQFRTFFMRRFRLPALEWSDAVLLARFRGERPVLFESEGERLRKLLKEFASARRALKVEGKDALQIAEKARELVERLEAAATKIERDKGRP